MEQSELYVMVKSFSVKKYQTLVLKPSYVLGINSGIKQSYSSQNDTSKSSRRAILVVYWKLMEKV